MLLLSWLARSYLRILPTAGSLVLTIAGVFPVPAGAVPAAPAGGLTPGAADARYC